MTDERVMLRFHANYGVFNANEVASFERHIADKILGSKMHGSDGYMRPLASVVKIEKVESKTESQVETKEEIKLIEKEEISLPVAEHVEKEKAGFLRRGRPRKS